MPHYTPSTTSKASGGSPSQSTDSINGPQRSRSQSLAEKIRRAFTGRPSGSELEGTPEGSSLQTNAVVSLLFHLPPYTPHSLVDAYCPTDRYSPTDPYTPCQVPFLTL